MFKINKTGQQLLELFNDVSTMSSDIDTIYGKVTDIEGDYASKSYVSQLISGIGGTPTGSTNIYVSTSTLVEDLPNLSNSIP